MRQILESLAILHDHRIIHRDIKPANVMVRMERGSPSLFIGDFGISGILKKNKVSHDKKGTPCYMAPEVMSDEGYGLKADIFSAGSIMFNLCSQR